MRTDRTFVCTACRVRTWPVRRCPACGETRSLGDLERTPLADLLEGRAPRQDARVPFALASGGAAGTVLSALAFGLGLVGVAEAGLVASVAALVVGLVRIPPSHAPGTQPWRLLESPIVRASRPRATHAGTVRARETLVSPLGRTPCVAWRLVGTSASMPIDDGRAVPFTLLAGSDEIEVDAIVATLELALPDATPRTLDTADPELARWLVARGIDPAGPIVVREAIVVAGGEIEVIGSARTETRADGYRGHATREVLADQPGSPLVVRSPKTAIGDGHVTIA